MALVRIPLEEVGSHTLQHQDEPNGNRTQGYHDTVYTPDSPTDIGTGNVGSIGRELTVGDGSNVSFVHMLQVGKRKEKDYDRTKKEGGRGCEKRMRSAKEEGV